MDAQADREHIMEKIQKLLALSESSNPNEAAIALQRAQKLMAEHQIKGDDPGLFGITSKKVPVPPALRDKECALTLCSIISLSFGTRHYVSYNGSSITDVTFVGRADRIEGAIYIFTFLCRQAAAAKSAYSKELRDSLRGEIAGTVARTKASIAGTALAHITQGLGERVWANTANRLLTREVRPKVRAYMRGWMISVFDKVQRFALDEEEERQIERYLSSLDLHNLGRRRVRMDDSAWESYDQGLQDGSDSFELHRGVYGRQGPLLGGK